MARETDVELALRLDAESRGGLCLKVHALGVRGFPDRWLLLPGVPPILVETKLPGEPVEAHQERMHRKLRELGLLVVVWDGNRCYENAR